MPRYVRPTHKMQRAFLVSRTSVHLVSARPLNNQARYNDVDFTRVRDYAPPVNSPEFLVGDLLQTGKRITKLDDFSMSRLTLMSTSRLSPTSPAASNTSPKFFSSISCS